MAKKNEAKIKFTAEAKEFSDTITQANKDIGSLRSELRLNATEMKNNGTSVEGLAKKQELLQKQQIATKTRTQALEKQLESAKKIYGDDSQEVAKLTHKLNVSKIAESNLDKQLKDTTDELKRQKKQMDLTAEQSQKLKDGLDKVGNASGAVAGGIVASGAGAVAAFNEVDDGADQVIRKTGATGKTAEALEQTYKNVASSIVGDYANIGDAVGEVNTKFHLEGKELENTTERFLQFANVNETDVVTSIDNAYQAQQKWNLSNDDTLLLLDQVTKKGQDTGISIDTIFQGINENSAVLKEMNFDVTQAVEYLAELEVSGISATDGFKAMKFAIKNATTDGKDLNSFLTENVSKIKNAKTETEALGIATDTFGNKNAPEMTKAIREGRLTLNGFTKSAKSYGGTVEKTFEQTLDGGENLKLAMQNVKIAVGEIGGAILEEIEPNIDDFVESTKEAVEWAKENGDKIVNTMKTVGVVAGTVFAVNKVAKFGRSLSDIYKGTSTVIKGIYQTVTARVADTTAIEAETVAQTGLNTAMSLSPMGALLIGTTALAAGIMVLANNTEYLSEESQKAIDDMNELNDSVSESNKSVSTEYDIYQRQIEQLDKVVDENGKVKKGKEDIAKAAINVLEPLGLELELVDGQFKGYKKLRNKIYDTIEAKKAEAYLEANKDEYIKALEQEKEYGKKIEDQKEKIKKLEEGAEKKSKDAEEFNKLPEKYPLAGDLVQAGYILTGQDPNQKIMGANAKIEQAEKELKNYENTYKNATNKIINYDKLQVASASGKTKKIKNATAAYDFQLKRATSSTKEELEKQFQDTKENVKNMKRLYDEGKISKAAVDEAKRTRRLAKKELDKANYKPEGKKGGESYAKGFKEADVDPAVRNLTNKIKRQLKDIKTLTVKANVKIKPTSTSIQGTRLQGLQSTVFGVQHNAVGNIIKNPILTTFAEDGPEAAIPINNKPRSRALWLKTGEMMGMINSGIGNQTIARDMELSETNALLSAILKKDSNMYVSGRKVSEATAGSRDSVDGINIALAKRGISIE